MRRMSIGVIVAGALAALAGTANGEMLYATTASGFLISFDSTSPSTTLTGVAIQGLAQNEEIVGMDLRPSTGQLYGLGSFGIMYHMNPATGFATTIGLIDGATLAGSAFGFDFNPVADRIRIQSDLEQNLRANPNVQPNTTVTDTSLDYSIGDINFATDPDISFSAYSNNVSGATSTTLYAIDANNDTLVSFLTPNDGQMDTIGFLGVDIGPRGGFDISGNTGIAYISALPAASSTSKLYTVDLSTGELTLVDEFAGGLELRTLTVIPAPSSIALLGLAAFGLRRRRA